jgi:asparagine synthase (glutamine-hydrolysing)
VPVRLAGLWGFSVPEAGAIASVLPALPQLLARYPAGAPWTRDVRPVASGLLIIDRTADVAGTGFAEAPDGAFGVAGTVRLDGRQELADLLGEPTLAGGDDAGLVLAAYRRWGAQSFERLRGDFALALWDRASNSLLLCRDPFGVRRLHYCRQGDRLLFSTEIEGVLAWPGVDREPDEVTILDALLARYQTRERTFFRAIRRVLPGHAMTFHAGGERRSRFIAPPSTGPRFTSLVEHAEVFRAALERAVAERLPPSGSVVCQLSGGLDSISVVCLAARQLGARGRIEDLVLATARFRGLRCDEGAVAARTASFVGRPLQEWDGTIPELSDLERPRAAWPFGRSSIGASWQGDLDWAEHVGATVLLSGQGGNQLTDEVDYLADRWREDGAVACAVAAARALRGRPWRWRRWYLGHFLRDARHGFLPPEVRRRYAQDPLLRPPPSWASARLRRAWRVLQDETVPDLGPRVPLTGSWMGDAVWTAMVDDPSSVWVLEHEDARATERGLEFRFPFLSWDLLALVLAVPWRLKAPLPYGRILHHEAMRGVVPDDVLPIWPMVYFNDANVSNYRRAWPHVARLASPVRHAAAFVRPTAVDAELRELDKLRKLRSSGTDASGPDSKLSVGPKESDAWRFARDVAALEAWLGLLSCYHDGHDA